MLKFGVIKYVNIFELIQYLQVVKRLSSYYSLSLFFLNFNQPIIMSSLLFRESKSMKPTIAQSKLVTEPISFFSNVYLDLTMNKLSSLEIINCDFFISGNTNEDAFLL